MKKAIFHVFFETVFALFFLSNTALCEDFARIDNNNLILDNGIIQRVISFGDDQGSITTTSFTLHGYEKEYLSPGSREFCFEINGKGYDGASGWTKIEIKTINDSIQGNGAVCTFSRRNGEGINFEIELTYLLYPELPIIRKKMSIKNNGDNNVRLEALNIEHLRLPFWSDVNSWIMTDYTRDRKLAPYVGNWHDPLIIVHNIHERNGIVLGNEVPGKLKRISTFEDGRSLTCGYTHPEQDCHFRKWLKPGEKWESSWVFTALYKDTSDPWIVVNGPVNDFVRHHMGIRTAIQKDNPIFMYDTWIPFHQDISERLLMDAADAASQCGVELFIIDCGWQTNYGDWEVDRTKFPNGLKPVFDRIRDCGMKPGLWLSLTSVQTSSKVYRDHPEWLVRDKDNKPVNLHITSTEPTDVGSFLTTCLSTGWYDYVKSFILRLVKEYNLAYIKLDFAGITSAYVYDNNVSGCYAKDHPHHGDCEESYLAFYTRCMNLFDEIHRESPELYIDCTFETWGALQLIDYALVQHAEGCWLCNIYEPVPEGSGRARNLAWHRSPVIPSGSMIIGNLNIDDPDCFLGQKSVAGTVPVMLGDPRNVPMEKRTQYRKWINWLRSMQDKHAFMCFRQDLPGFGEPCEGRWDGWTRINTDTQSGGILGIFRQGGIETERIVSVQGLDPDSTYVIRKAPEGAMLYRMTGKKLSEEGFTVLLKNTYDAALFEIELEK